MYMYVYDVGDIDTCIYIYNHKLRSSILSLRLRARVGEGGATAKRGKVRRSTTDGHLRRPVA